VLATANRYTKQEQVLRHRLTRTGKLFGFRHDYRQLAELIRSLPLQKIHTLENHTLATGHLTSMC